MKPRMHAKISVALVWLGAILSLMLGDMGRWALWLGLAISIVGLIYRMVMVRCPICGKSVDGFQTLPSRCPNCGEALD